jgi:short-subunit dehydrogenase
MFVDGLAVMIVGAGPGLGATLARRCAVDGADVVVAARTQSTLDQVLFLASDSPRASPAPPST